MRLAILADIHANLPALEAVVSDLTLMNVQQVLVAGDLLGGPKPEETLRLLRSLDPQMIRGNGDTYLLQYRAGRAPIYWYTSKAFASIRWHYRHSIRETLEFIETLPEQRVFKKPKIPAVRVVHGSPSDPSESILPDFKPDLLKRALAETTEPVLVCGHTHLSWHSWQAGRLALNPGAVGCPLNGDTNAQYALLDWDGEQWHIEHRRVAYDLELIRRDYTESGLLIEGGAFARACLCSIESGRNIMEEFLTFARQLLGKSGANHNGFLPDEIWDQATDQFAWPEYLTNIQG